MKHTAQVISMDSIKYENIVISYANNIYRLAYGYCGNKSDAEDVMQNTFLKLLTTDTAFQDEEHIRKWLIRVAANEAKNICRSSWRRRVVSYDALDQELKMEDFDRENQYVLFQAVTSLPEKYRFIVHLYYYETYSVKEIAALLELKETTVQTRLQRARQKLKKMLKEEWQYEQ